MNKYIFSIAVWVIGTMVAYGGPVDESQAKALASKYLNNPVSMSESQTMAYSRETKTVDPTLHLFNNQDGDGFVIVAADDRVGGVLGYSDRGHLDAANMPAPLIELLAGYSRAVEKVRVDSISVTQTYIHGVHHHGRCSGALCS